MNQSQNEKKTLTAYGIRSRHGLNNSLLLPVEAIDRAMQEFAAQEVKENEGKWMTAANDATNEGLSHYTDQVKQVTEERDKSVEMLSESLIQLKYLDNRFPTGSTPNVVSRIATFLNSLNAASSDTGGR